MGYCSISDIKDKSISDILTNAGWTDNDIQALIDEGSNVINSYLLKVGYTPDDLMLAPLIKRINVLLTKYRIMQDIYANTTPSKTEQREFVKWKDYAFSLLEKIANGELILTDSNGQIIVNKNKTFIPLITTIETKRIFKIGKEAFWDTPDFTYSNEDVIGEK